MNIGSIQYPVFNPYNKPTIEIYISGCKRHCKFCHNPELQDFNFGEKLVLLDLIKFLKERENLFEIISLTGGDLLCQNLEEAETLCITLHNTFSNKKFWLFTGEDKKKNLPKWVFEVFDVIKIGHYDYRQSCEGFPSSKNQRVIYNK